MEPVLAAARKLCVYMDFRKHKGIRALEQTLLTTNLAVST